MTINITVRYMRDLPQTVQQKRDEFLNSNGRYRVYDIKPKNHNSLNFIDASRILGNTRLTLDDKLPNENYTEVKENGSIYKLMYLSNPNNPSIKTLINGGTAWSRVCAC